MSLRTRRRARDSGRAVRGDSETSTSSEESHMTYENMAAPVATRRRPAPRLSTPALGVAALGALLTVVATFLNWATLTLQGETPVTANGLDEDMNGRITVVL